MILRILTLVLFYPWWPPYSTTMTTEVGSERNESKVAEVALSASFGGRAVVMLLAGGVQWHADPTRADLPALEAAVNRLARRAGACVRLRASKQRADWWT